MGLLKRVSFWPYPQILNLAEKSNKRPDLFTVTLNIIFITLAIGGDVIQSIPLSLMKRQNNVECLALASIISPANIGLARDKRYSLFCFFVREKKKFLTLLLVVCVILYFSLSKMLELTKLGFSYVPIF
jgi:hypothetical protein